MKHARILGVIAALLLAIATPSTSMAQSWWEGFAGAPQANSFQEWLTQHPNMSGPLYNDPYQIYDPGWRSQHPEFQQYINSNPGWWNGMRSNRSQYYDERFSEFLSNHPEVARDLRQNPDLIYDPRYRAQRPELNTFFAGHRRIWRSIKYQTYTPVRSYRGGWGAYGNDRQWRDADWWKDNGDWDDNRQWHDRAWWQQNNRTWAEQRHPNWYAKHEAHQDWKAQQNAAKEQRREGKETAKEAKHPGRHDRGPGGRDNN
jgi:hypothetical protein